MTSGTRDIYDLRAQEEAAQRDNANAAADRALQIEDLKWLMQHPAGRRIAKRIISITGVRRLTFNPSGSVMAFNEGRRNVGIWWEAELCEAVPEGYFRLMKEHASE